MIRDDHGGFRRIHPARLALDHIEEVERLIAYHVDCTEETMISSGSYSYS